MLTLFVRLIAQKLLQSTIDEPNSLDESRIGTTWNGSESFQCFFRQVRHFRRKSGPSHRQARVEDAQELLISLVSTH